MSFSLVSLLVSAGDGHAQVALRPLLPSRFSQDSDPMPAAGRFRGQLVENSVRRTLVLLTEDEKKDFGIPQGQIAFANFRHNQQFHIATIPGMKVDSNQKALSSESLIEKIVLSKKHWAGQTRPQTKQLEVHAELVYFFKSGKGIQLIYNQDTQTMLSRPLTLKGLVYSVEAIRSKTAPDVPFFPDAMGSNFAIGHRVVSIHERNVQHQGDPERTISSHALKLSDKGSLIRKIPRAEDALLYAAIKMSELKGRREAYHIVANNCTNNIFSLLDQVLRYPSEFKTDVLRAEITRFVRGDLPRILEYLKAMASQDPRLAADPRLKAELDAIVLKLGAVTELTVRQMDLDELRSPQNYLGQVPAFIKGHLAARGLIL